MFGRLKRRLGYAPAEASEDENFEAEFGAGETTEDDDESEEEEAGPVTKKGGRGFGCKTVGRRLLDEFTSKKAAIAAGKVWLEGNCRAKKNGNSWTYTGECATHLDCPRHFKVMATEPQGSLPRRTADYVGSWGLYVPVEKSDVEHSASQTLTWTGRGVDDEFRARLAM
jgi:hypothetical protein